MDPVFNDTSTYERSEYEQQHQQSQSQSQENGWSGVPTGGQDGLSRDAGSLQQRQPGNPVMNDTSVSVTNFYSSHQPGSEHGGHVHPEHAHAEASHSHAPAAPVSPGYATASEIDTPSNPAQSARGDDAQGATTSNAAGVNFQTLLDNLSHPPPSGATANAPPLAEGSSLHQAPNDESVQGLPARPYQDPSAQPNYPSSGDLSYHQHPAPTTTSSSAYAAQSSNHAQQPFPPSMASGGAPGTEPIAGNLPPPPVATFQHNPPPGAESQASQEAAKKGRTDKQPLRTGKGGDDDAPWGPEVQKKYDEFLHDERIYVTEGLWDRFPMGSRLFVGQYRPYHCVQDCSTDLFCSSQATFPPNE